MSFFEFPHTRTYDSDLGWLIQEVTKIAEEYQSLVDFMNNHEVEYEELKRRVDLLESNINTFENQIDARFEALSNEFEQQFNVLDRELKNELRSEIQAALAELNRALGNIYAQITAVEASVTQLRLDTNGQIRAYFDLSLQYTDSKIAELISHIPDLTTVNVFNPVRGTITSIQVAVNDLYDIGRPDALTAEEYDNLGLTALEFDDIGMTALEYDLYGRRILEELGYYKNPAHYMYSPFTGEYVPIKEVVLELSYLHQSDTLTAEEYDLKELTAADYDALNLSAYDYDWHGKSLIV